MFSTEFLDERKRMTQQRIPEDVAATSAEDERVRAKGDTWAEIYQQPMLWPTTLERVRQAIERLQLQSRLRDAKVVITGAGTSAYAAAAVSSAWPGSLAVPSTDLLLAAERYLTDTSVLVSLARSGDSPESLAAVERVHRIKPGVWHLAVTCNAAGALASSPLVNSIVLDPRTNDRSLVMTSSFSNLVLAGLCLTNADLIEPVISYASQEAPGNFALVDEQAKKFAARVKDRVLLLASDPLVGWAKEGALKILEMTAGEFPVMAETYLGLRHGPMSFVRPDTLVICLLSSDPWRQRYEIDLISELCAKDLGSLVGICATDHNNQLFDETIPALAPAAPDSFRAPFEIMGLQLLGYHLSRRVGLNPDNPSPSGAINRVVQGVQIYG